MLQDNKAVVSTDIKDEHGNDEHGIFFYVNSVILFTFE